MVLVGFAGDPIGHALALYAARGGIGRNAGIAQCALVRVAGTLTIRRLGRRNRHLVPLLPPAGFITGDQ